MAKKNNIASVLAFEKKLVPSDGYMYGTTWDERYEKCAPVTLKEKSVRGTVSNRLNIKKEELQDPLKLNKKLESPNPHTVDHASLTLQEDTLKVEFTLKVLSGVQYPSACNEPEQRETIRQFGEKYIQETGFKEIARRYAVNIANGRFLWRNRVGAEKLEVVAHLNDKDLTFNSYDYSLKKFDYDDPQINELAEAIASALCGKEDSLLIHVTAFAFMGAGQDVYPSEEMILDKDNDKGDKSKVLYSVNGIAAMHSQKLEMLSVPLIPGIRTMKTLTSDRLPLKFTDQSPTWEKPTGNRI